MSSPTDDRVDQHLSRVASGGVINLIGAVVSAVSGFALVWVVARGFEPESAGVLFSASSVFLVAVASAVFGADTALIRFVSHLEESGRSGDIAATMRRAWNRVVIVGVGIGAFSFVTAEPLASVLGLDHPQAVTVVRILAIGIPFAASAQFSYATTRALGRMRPTVVIDNLFRTAAQTGAAAVVGLFGGGLVSLGSAWVLPYFVAAPVAAVVARRLVRRRSVRWDDVGDADSNDAVRREFGRFALSRGVARFSQILVQRLDVVLVAALVGTAPAALYTAATRFVVVGQMGAQAVSNVLMPRLARLLTQEAHDTVRTLFKLSTSWSMAVAWPLYVSVAVASSLYLDLFGEEYSTSAGIAVVVTMSCTMMIATACGSLDSVLLMGGRSVASLVNGLVAVGLNVILCFTLIPPFGIVGAALAWSAAVLVRNLLAFVQVQRDLPISSASRSALLVATAVVVCYAAPLLTLLAFGLLAPLTLILAVAVGTAVYLGLLWRSREVLALSAFRSALPSAVSRRLARRSGENAAG